MSVLDDSPRKVVFFTVLASVLWCGAFAIGRVTGHLLAALVPFAVLSSAVIVRNMPEVRARLRPRVAEVLWGIAAGGVSVGATYLCYPVIVAAWPPLHDEVRSLYALLNLSPLHLLPVLAVVVGEELLWRGALLMALRRDHVHVVAVALAASVYAAAQLGSGSIILALVALLLGVFWSALAAWRRSLVPSLVAHALWTPTIMLLVPLER